jgi:chaperonin GroES
VYLQPLYDRVLIKRMDLPKSTLLLIPENAKQKPQHGEVIATGKGKRTEDGELVPLDVRPGDRVFFSKFAGSDIEMGSEEFLLLRENEILGVFA